jgi:predicted transcriptional regulator
MMKTFSTKLDANLLRLLEEFCKRYHLKKSHVLKEIIAEGIRRRAQVLELARSLQKGLEEEERGELYTADEVEQAVFGKKKAG